VAHTLLLDLFVVVLLVASIWGGRAIGRHERQPELDALLGTLAITEARVGERDASLEVLTRERDALRHTVLTCVKTPAARPVPFAFRKRFDSSLVAVKP
jgi:hypothetical protein